MANTEEQVRERLSFGEHARVLIHHLRRIFYAVIIFTIFAMVFPLSINLAGILSGNPQYLTPTIFLIRKFQIDFLPPNVSLVPVSWFSPLEVYLYVSVMFGAVLSLPVIAYELYKFINPALFAHEKKMLYPFVVSFCLLFTIGFLIGYFLVVPLTIRMLLLFIEPLGITPLYEFSSFYSLVVGGLLVCGLLFTAPVFFVILVQFEIIDTDQITKNRKMLYPGIIIGIAIIDPDPTLVTELLIGLPLILLVELSILITRRIERKRAGG